MSVDVRILLQGEHSLLLKDGDHIHALGNATIQAMCPSDSAVITIMATDTAEVVVRGRCWRLEILKTSGIALIDALELESEEVIVKDVAGSSVLRLSGDVRIGTIRDTAAVHVVGKANVGEVLGRGRIVVTPKDVIV